MTAVEDGSEVGVIVIRAAVVPERPARGVDTAVASTRVQKLSGS